ncbi:hypothetical protein [Desmospora activa]|uniref:Uncharacterized protein n=1 Tax=Desmospora activa DSM 45169 TaxID=1121389 RepID=A0A2T4Z1U0_9BACL|nr:hypothetical protein [Desmospora activa]PTM54739.1 hypothetical protein C8J48_3391 [Desmospora activa DSM 45169]
MLMQLLFTQPGIGMSVGAFTKGNALMTLAIGIGGSGLSNFSYPDRRPSCRGVIPF